MHILSKSWFIATLALILTVGTNIIAFNLYKPTLFPKPTTNVLLVKREDPATMLWGFSSEEIKSLERELKDRLSILEIREGELASYEARLKTDRAEIEDIKKQVERMRDELMEGIVQLELDEEKNLKTLAKTYATLTPDAAVRIFRELDPPTVVKILFFMKSDTVGAILQEMATANGGNADQIERAAEISDMLRLFTRNPQNDLQQNI